MIIDDVKAFWDSNPCNIRHSKAEIGTQEYFDQVEFRKYKVEPHIPTFADFPKWRGKRVLEIGCGIGTDAVNFARHGADYTGIELSEKSLQLTQRRFEVFGLKGTLLLGNAGELMRDMKDDFDLIYSFGVLHHTPDAPDIVEAAADLMTKGSSELRFMVYATQSLKQICIDAGLDQPESRRGCPIANTYTQQQVRTLLWQFGDIEIKQAHIFPYDIERYIAHEYVVAPWIAAMPKAMFEAMEHRLGWHLLVKALLC